jgi:hypothetical protein
VHLNNSLPIVLSTCLEMMKHVEHALSSKESSRTEIKGSRRRSGDPAGTDCVATRPLPRGLEDADSSTFSLELDSLIAVEAVTAEVIILNKS